MGLFKDFKRHNQDFINGRIIILIIVGMSFLFRQNIYSSIVTYRIGQERVADTQLDAVFEHYILTHPDVYDRRFDNIEKIVLISLKVTADALSYKGDKTLKTDPLSILRLGEANSEGYAAFFNAVCSYLINRYHFSDQYHCRQFIAERMKGGINLEDAFQSPYGGSSPFNKNRDIVAIVDTKTGNQRFVDPVIYDQFNIVDIGIGSIISEEPSRSTHNSRLKRSLFHKP